MRLEYGFQDQQIRCHCSMQSQSTQHLHKGIESLIVGRQQYLEITCNYSIAHIMYTVYVHASTCRHTLCNWNSSTAQQIQ